jgi:hypothetical protein
MGIFCVSTPAVKPVFKRFAPYILSSSYGYADSKNIYGAPAKPSTTVASHSRCFKPRGAIELDDNTHSETFVQGSITRSQSSVGFWRERDVENDATSLEGILPFMGAEKEGKAIVKHTVVTIETRNRKGSDDNST